MKQLSFLLISLFILFIACDPNEIFDPCGENMWYVDNDGDGYGIGEVMQLTDCTDTTGYARNNFDCNDNNADVFEELTYFIDEDGDGYGNTTMDSLSCNIPVGYVLDNTDCDDSNENIIGEATYYEDNDGDGFGAGEAITTCEPEDNYVDNDNDCDDTNPDLGEEQTWYQDADGDGLGNPDVSVVACEQPDGYVSNDNDDDDTMVNENGDFGYYYPLEVGNKWTFESNGEQALGEVISSFDDNGITKFNIQSIVENNTGVQITWYDNGIGYTVAPVGSNLTEHDIKLLDDNKDIDETWSQTFTETVGGVEVSYIYDFKIIDILDEYTVGDNDFTDVKIVESKITSSAGGFDQELSLSTYYWTPGIGLIEATIEDLMTGSTLLEQYIVSWDIQ